jgi:hypothetical protein
MAWGAAAAAGATLLTAYITAQERRRAAEEANAANVGMTSEQIAEQRRQFDIGQEADLRREQAAADLFARTAALEESRYAGEVSRGEARYADALRREEARYADVTRRGEARYGGEVTRGREAVLSKRAREDLINQQIQDRFKAIRGENIGRLTPYTEAGRGALTEQQALLGLSGQGAQQEAYARFTESPGQAFLRERQERALLRNAAAIGGLGGGNVRTALQEQAFGRAQTDLDRQLTRLGVVSGQGLTAAQEAARTGYGPGYVSTGVDLGVPSEYDAAAVPDFNAAAVPEYISPTYISPEDMHTQRVSGPPPEGYGPGYIPPEEKAEIDMFGGNTGNYYRKNEGFMKGAPGIRRVTR